MTRDKIISMAREAGGYDSPQYPDNLVMDIHDLQRFYALAIDHKCELLAAENERLREALESAKESLWNYGCNKPAREAEKVLDATPDTLAAEILAKRDAEVIERCAVECETIANYADEMQDSPALTVAGKQLNSGVWGGAMNCAAAIRALAAEIGKEPL